MKTTTAPTARPVSTNDPVIANTRIVPTATTARESTDEVVADKSLDAPVLKELSAVPTSDAETLQWQTEALARTARDAFIESCDLSDLELAETSFFSARDKLQDLWNYASLRNEAFQTLLGLIDAALVGTSLTDLNPSQRDAIRLAFADVTEYFLQQSDVDRHIRTFMEQRLDIFAPLRPKPGKRLRVIVEEINDEAG